jgi:hypothetical protein
LDQRYDYLNNAMMLSNNANTAVRWELAMHQARRSMYDALSNHDGEVQYVFFCFFDGYGQPLFTKTNNSYRSSLVISLKSKVCARPPSSLPTEIR